MADKCEKCYYQDGRVGSCDYFLVTGKRRGCSPKNCDKFKPKDKVGRRSSIALPCVRPETYIKRSAMRFLYDQGLHDRLIAEKIGCSKALVTQWRIKAGLPPLNRTSGRKGVEDHGEKHQQSGHKK